MIDEPPGCTCLPSHPANLGALSGGRLLAWVKRLLPLQIPTCQLRIKQATPEELGPVIREAVALGNTHGCQLSSSMITGNRRSPLGPLGSIWDRRIWSGLIWPPLPARAVYGSASAPTANSNGHSARSLRPSAISRSGRFSTPRPNRFAPSGLERPKRWVPLLNSTVLTAIGGIDREKRPSACYRRRLYRGCLCDYPCT